MPGLYGPEALLVDKWIKDWAYNVQSNVKHWRNQPILLQQSIARSFEERHKACNRLRELIGVAKINDNAGDWKGFINCNLTSEQREEYASWDIQDADVWDGIATYGEKGFKFTLTYNSQNSSWVACYIGGATSGKNSGYAVNGFAPSPYDAARVLLFKVSCILPDVWKDYKPLPSQEVG